VGCTGVGGRPEQRRKRRWDASTDLVFEEMVQDPVRADDLVEWEWWAREGGRESFWFIDSRWGLLRMRRIL
jgi:hypothetical protein